MYKLDRRRFLKLLGQGSLVLGLGLSGEACTQKEGPEAEKLVETEKDAQVQKAEGSYWDEWEFYYPGKYDAQDEKILEGFQAELDQINKAEINIEDLVSGKLARGTPGVGRETRVTYNSMMEMSKVNVADNPLFNDREYAEKTKYGELIAFPLISLLEVMPAMPKSAGFGDYMVVSDLNHSMVYHKPFYEGDTLYSVIDEQHFKDITPSAGSHYRTFLMKGWARIFNQKGDLVAEGASSVKESFRRRKDPAKRNPDGAHAWESPDWWHQRQAHIYTDKDWEEIIGIWKNEKVRGAEPLYWDDVNIGDEPAPNLIGPILAETETDMLASIPQWCIDTKKNVLDPKTFAKMVKNKQGIYVLPEYLEKKPRGSGRGPMMAGGEMPEGGEGPPPDAGMSGAVTPEIANRDGRAMIGNDKAMKMAAGMLCNWMGDQGWLQRIGWDIMAVPPGSDESISYEDPQTYIPPITKEMLPALFDKYPYMEKVPYMKGKRADCHGMEGDVVISRAYVTDKYNKGSEYFVDLTWWCETIDNYLIEEGFATVKLPKRA